MQCGYRATSEVTGLYMLLHWAEAIRSSNNGSEIQDFKHIVFKHIVFSSSLAHNMFYFYSQTYSDSPQFED